MNIYQVSIKFKHGGSLGFDIETNKNIKSEINKEWETSKKSGALSIGDYIVTTDDIQWIKVKGEAIKDGKIFEKRSRR